MSRQAGSAAWSSLLRLASIAGLFLGPGELVAQRSISGTVYAAPGEDIYDTWVIACHVVNDHCAGTSRQSTGYKIKARGGSATYEIRNLKPGQYHLVAFKDRNGNGNEDRDDWSGHFPAPDGRALAITPPMRNVDVRLRLGGVADAKGPAAAPATTPVAKAPPPPRGAPAATPPPADKAIGAIFVGLRDNWNMNRGVPVKNYNEHLFALLPDGRALYTAPVYGLWPAIDWSRCASGMICGTYTVEGNQVNVSFNNGYHQTFVREGRRLTQIRAYWDGHEDGGSNTRRPYMQVDSHNDLRLDGRWAVVDDRDGRESVAITLTKDGRFTERGLIEPTSIILPWDDRQARERLRISGGSGTYRIMWNTLELQYANGPKLHFLFTVTPEVRWSPKPERIQINRIELANVQ